MKNLFLSLFTICCITLTIGCGPAENNANDLLNDTIAQKDSTVDDELIGQLITIVPNPLQLSELLQKSGVVYNSDLLVPSANVDKFTTNYKKALNLGTYGSDLVHMNIYGQTVSTLTYLKNIKDLANDLKIGQFFKIDILNRLSENRKNVDSILYITNSSFDLMTNYLIEQKRSNIAVLIAFGTWIENLYLATNIYAVEEKQKIWDRVGEQKIVLDNIIILLSAFKNDPNFSALIEKTNKLKTEFDKVLITFDYKEPTIKEVDGKMVVIDNSTSSIVIDEAIFNSIGKVIAEIRNEIVS